MVGLSESSPGGEFRLAEWRVRPSLNRITSDATSVQLEPKQMDVLVFLARNAGEVVSKDAIADAVWRQRYYSEWVITRAIAGLRRALGDDAREPRFIETIAKRGYRLLIAPGMDAPDPPAIASRGKATAAGHPFPVGQWVRGEGFYGRIAQVAEVLDGNRNGIWLLGTRMIGKTSLLRQLEAVAREEPEGRYFPLFWDFQGAAEPADLHAGFSEALLEAEESLADFDIPLSEVAREDLFLSLAALRRAVRSRGRRLILRCDEVEELLHLKDHDPALLRKLRRALQSPDDLRCVLSASSRLWALAEHRQDTSPFLHGFTPPLYLGPLRPEEAAALVRQEQLPGPCRPALAEDLVGELCRVGGNHPYLLQLLCRTLLEVGELEAATERVTADPTVALLFQVDLEALGEQDEGILRALVAGPSTPAELADRLASDTRTLAGRLHSLQCLGLTAGPEGGAYTLANPLLARWLAGCPPGA